MIYANENDRHAASWLSFLPLQLDEIDDRSIAEVKGKDLAGFTQCHFFAGIAGWPLALKIAGWPNSLPVWTGSCPCQPFSAAGKQRGTSDERHLWPEFLRLITECKPPVLFGEQVASKLGRQWLAGVRADLEALGYAVGAADLCAAGAGSPHIRQRLFWVAYAASGEQWWDRQSGSGGQREVPTRGRRSPGRMGDTTDDNTGPGRQPEESRSGRAVAGGPNGDGCGLDNATGTRFQGAQQDTEGDSRDETRLCLPGTGRAEGSGLEHTESHGREQGRTEPVRRLASVRRCETGFWSDADYLYCTDGKYRPVEPGLEPLVNGLSARMASGVEISKNEMSRAKALKGVGNAIVPQVAAVFIRSFMESL